MSQVLEPRAPDSYFNWNFFDAILQQKEGFSSYVFEDKAKEILDQRPDLKLMFEAKRNADEKFRSNAYDQLNWIYQRSEYFENTKNQYPVYRLD